MGDIPKLNFGPPVLREWADAVAKEVKRATPINGTSIQVNDSESGRVVNWMPPNPGDGSLGGIGGGGDLPTCADTRTIGTISTSLIKLPCSGETQSTIDVLSTSHASEDGNVAAINGGDGSLQLTNGSSNVFLNAADIVASSGNVTLKEIDVPHMGAPGKRQFLCGDAYAA